MPPDGMPHDIYEENVIYAEEVMYVWPSFETPSLREGPQDEDRDLLKRRNQPQPSS
jgi:hypothetical protein